MQKRGNSSALAMELRLSCINSSILTKWQDTLSTLMAPCKGNWLVTIGFTSQRASYGMIISFLLNWSSCCRNNEFVSDLKCSDAHDVTAMKIEVPQISKHVFNLSQFSLHILLVKNENDNLDMMMCRNIYKPYNEWTGKMVYWTHSCQSICISSYDFFFFALSLHLE